LFPRRIRRLGKGLCVALLLLLTPLSAHQGSKDLRSACPLLASDRTPRGKASRRITTSLRPPFPLKPESPLRSTPLGPELLAPNLPSVKGPHFGPSSGSRSSTPAPWKGVLRGPVL
jgi:hypothetical protein